MKAKIPQIFVGLLLLSMLFLSASKPIQVEETREPVITLEPFFTVENIVNEIRCDLISKVDVNAKIENLGGTNCNVRPSMAGFTSDGGFIPI